MSWKFQSDKVVILFQKGTIGHCISILVSKSKKMKGSEICQSVLSISKCGQKAQDASVNTRH